MSHFLNIFKNFDDLGKLKIQLKCNYKFSRLNKQYKISLLFRTYGNEDHDQNFEQFKALTIRY